MTNPVARLWEPNYTQDGEQLTVKEVLTFCPGCESAHPFTIDNGGLKRSSGEPRPTWQWDGNLESPTFAPSLLCYSTVQLCKDQHIYEDCVDHDGCGHRSHKIMNYYEVADESLWIYAHDVGPEHEHTWGNCHSFLRNGIWEFLGDSAHSLAGQHVSMVPLPDFLMKRGF